MGYIANFHLKFDIQNSHQYSVLAITLRGRNQWRLKMVLRFGNRLTFE